MATYRNELKRNRSHCDCGNRATIVKSGFKICARCAELENRLAFEFTPERKINVAGEPLHVFRVRLERWVA